MKPIRVVLLCVLTLAFHFSYHTPTDGRPFSLPPMVKDGLSARHFLRELSFTSNPAGKHEAEKVGVMEGVEVEGESARGGHSDEDDEGLIYSADYRGVTTHPSPMPKHPRP